MPKVSIIVPIYNSEQYLEKCIESVLMQTFSDYELILVDDGSTDKSREICDLFAKRDDRIKIFSKENGGVSSARNLGLKLAEGEFISFLDSDDWLEKHFLENAIEICAEKEVDIFMAGYTRITKEKSTKVCIMQDSIFKSSDQLTEKEWVDLLACNYISAPFGKLYKRTKIGLTRFDETMCFGEDLKFNFEQLDKNVSIYACNQAFYYYHETFGSLTQRTTLEKCKSALETYRVLYEKVRTGRFPASGIYNTFVDRRWESDFLTMENQILKERSFLRKNRMLNALTDDRELCKIIRQSEDLYLKRYATYPRLLLLYRKYKEWIKKYENRKKVRI